MKKTTLLFGASLLALSASAQFKTQQPFFGPSSDQTTHRKGSSFVQGDNAAAKTTAVAPRWYNHAQALGTAYGVDINDETLSSLSPVWPDSSVHFTATGGGMSPYGINWMAFGEVFAPQTTLYNGVNSTNRGKLRVTSSDPYTVDSVEIRGVYSRTRSYDDTLMLVFVTETATTKAPALTFGGNTAANHGIDSAVAMLWPASRYQKLLTQISYSISGNSLSSADTVKIPLTAATFADSTAEGIHRVRARVAKSIVANGKVMMSITFKPGTSYTANTPITDYNFFSLLSHETEQDGFVVYPVTDQNMSYMAYKDSTNNSVNSTLYYFIPTIAYNGTGTSNFNPEIHDISWKVSCPSCVAVGVADVAAGLNIGEAYPNPARTKVTIPVSVKSAAVVSVSLSNTLGQVVARQSLNSAAGQTQNVVFATEALANGVYIYTVEANGERVTNRVVVAH